MFYLKIFENKSFIETPLPTIFVFFTLSGLIFFSFNLVVESIKKLTKNNLNNKKNYKII